MRGVVGPHPVTHIARTVLLQTNKTQLIRSSRSIFPKELPDSISQLIPILRTQIPHLRLLVLCQADTRGRAVPCAVLVPAGAEIQRVGHDAQRGKGKADAVARDVAGRVGGEEGVDCDYAWGGLLVCGRRTSFVYKGEGRREGG